MLLMRTIEDPAYPLGKLVSTKLTLGLDHFALAMNPFGLYGVKPRTLLGQKAAYDPHSTCAVLDVAVIFVGLDLPPLTLAHSNRSAPLSASRARNSMYCTTEPTGRYRLERSSGSLACGPCTFGARARSGGGRR